MIEWISTIASVILGATSIILAMRLRKRKSLAYEIIAETTLLRIDDQIKNEIEITYRQKHVKNIYLLLIKIINNGNEHISKEDFRKPIFFKFHPQAEILNVGIADSDPEELQIWFERAANNIAGIIADLINPKEWFTLKFIVAEYGNFEIDARIAGIKRLIEYSSYRVLYPYYIGACILIILTAISVMIFIDIMTQVDLFPSIYLKVTPVLMTLMIIVFLVLGTLARLVRIKSEKIYRSRSRRV